MPRAPGRNGGGESRRNRDQGEHERKRDEQRPLVERGEGARASRSKRRYGAASADREPLRRRSRGSAGSAHQRLVIATIATRPPTICAITASLAIGSVLSWASRSVTNTTLPGRGSG